MKYVYHRGATIHLHYDTIHILYGEDVHKIEIAASQIDRRLKTRKDKINKMKMQSTALSTNPDIEPPEIC